MPKNTEKAVVYNLRETYHEPGTYSFKIVLHPRYFKNSHDSQMALVDSSGQPMKYKVEKWGRKINCTFTIDESVAEGVAKINLLMVPEKGDKQSGLFSFWIIK